MDRTSPRREGLQAPAQPGETRGEFFIAADKDRSAIELCLNDFENTGLTVRGGLTAAVVGKSVEIEFLPKPGWASVSATMDELLQEARNRIRAKQLVPGAEHQGVVR